MTDGDGDPSRWERLRVAFDAVLTAPAAEREHALAEATGGDAELRRELEELLLHDDEAGTFLSDPGGSPPISAPAAALRTGARVGEYELVRPLGSGGMGAVWEARGERPRRAVALKLLRLGLFSERDARRFEFEAEVLARLQHPGIAQVYASGTHEGLAGPLPWIAMELVPGARDLATFAAERGLPLEGRLRLFELVCDAIAHAHSRGVLHRDLKPANVLVGDDGRPRVIDFGIARLREEDEGRDAALTQEGQILGTLQYMAPEQLSGAGGDAVDTRADVWALGVLLHELSCGRPPFALGGVRLAEAVRVLAEEEPPRPTSVAPGLPREVEWIVLRAMEKDRERRYASVADLAADVRRFLAREPLLAGPPSVLYRARKYVARHRARVTAAALVALALVAGGTGVALSLARVASEHGKVRRLSDARTLDRLEARAETLFPPVPALVDDLSAWLADARALAAGLPEHEAVLADLRARADAAGAFEDDEHAWWHEAQAELVGRLRGFADPERGRLADVERRLAFASEVEERSVSGARARALWDAARRAAADPDGPYALSGPGGGLALAPQLGLLPLGADPRSGLQEFAHLATGEAPARGADGALRLGPESGVVLVLLPGGAFAMGAEPPSAERPPGTPNVDPIAVTQARWGPVHEVTLAPFFLAKHETTRAQWARAAGEMDAAGGGPPLAPADHVSWFDAERAAVRLGLALPTEAQWEYAARGGTATPLWFGDAPADWSGIEWVADASPGATARPVGLLPPNPFGLHDLLGNLQEWCADRFGAYSAPARAADGLRLVETGTQRALRGGFYHLPADSAVLLARSAARAMDSPTARYERLGVRFARALDP